MSPPQSPSPGIHLSSARFTKDISFGKSEDSSIYKISVRANRAWIVLLIFTALFSHPPVGNVNIESRKSRNNLFNLVYFDSSINSSIDLSITYKNNYLFKYFEQVFLKKSERYRGRRTRSSGRKSHAIDGYNTYKTNSTFGPRDPRGLHRSRLPPTVHRFDQTVFLLLLLPLLSPDQPNHPSGTTLFQPRPKRER